MLSGTKEEKPEEINEVIDQEKNSVLVYELP